MTTRRRSFTASGGAVISPSGRWLRFELPVLARCECAPEFHSEALRRRIGLTNALLRSCVAMLCPQASRPVARAAGDQSLATPLLENLLGLLVCVDERRLGAHAPRVSVSEPGGQHERVAEHASRRVRSSRVPDTRSTCSLAHPVPRGPFKAGTKKMSSATGSLLSCAVR